MYYILGVNVLISVNIVTLVDERHKFIYFFLQHVMQVFITPFH